MNTDRSLKTRSVWPTLQVKIALRKGVYIGIFEPAAEPHTHRMLVTKAGDTVQG